jgi:hypothetical protein
MSIVSESDLSPSELAMLGNNVIPPVKSPRRRRRRIRAINRSLARFDECIARLYRPLLSGRPHFSLDRRELAPVLV